MDAIVKRPTLHLRFSTDTGTRRSPIKSFADLKPRQRNRSPPARTRICWSRMTCLVQSETCLTCQSILGNFASPLQPSTPCLR